MARRASFRSGASLSIRTSAPARARLRAPFRATCHGSVGTEVVSRGKHLLLRIDGDNDPLTLHTHFRMDGSWHLYRHGDAWRGGPQWQVRVLGLHMLHIGVVVGHAHQHAGGLAEVLAHPTEIIEHSILLHGLPGLQRSPGSRPTQASGWA